MVQVLQPFEAAGVSTSSATTGSTPGHVAAIWIGNAAMSGVSA